MNRLPYPTMIFHFSTPSKASPPVVMRRRVIYDAHVVIPLVLKGFQDLFDIMKLDAVAEAVGAVGNRD